MTDIMVDIDDVLMPWAQTVHDKCGEYGLHDGTVPWGSWHMWEDYGCTQEDWLYAVERAVEDGLYTKTAPYYGAVQGVRRLHAAGHRIHIVTARGFMENGDDIRRWTPDWLDTFGVPYDSLTFNKSKVAAMDDLGVRFDYAIDDGVHNYTALDEAGINVWLCDRPHNRTHPTDRRIASMAEFAELVWALETETS